MWSRRWWCCGGHRHLHHSYITLFPITRLLYVSILTHCQEAVCGSRTIPETPKAPGVFPLLVSSGSKINKPSVPQLRNYRDSPSLPSHRHWADTDTGPSANLCVEPQHLQCRLFHRTYQSRPPGTGHYARQLRRQELVPWYDPAWHPHAVP